MKGIVGVVLLFAAAAVHVHNSTAFDNAIYVRQLKYVVGPNAETQQLATVVVIVAMGASLCIGQLAEMSKKLGAGKKRR